MANGGGGNGTSTPGNAFEARLDTSVGLTDTLTLRQYAGQTIGINGRTITVPGGGLSRLVGDNLIDASGADAGSPPAASTLYYVYVSNAQASFSPSSIRLSAQAPTPLNGVKYLGATGNAANWRFVGWVRTTATPQFESSATNALIVNYYNRLLRTILANPAYTDDDSITTYSVAGNWAAANGGDGSQVKLISNGEDISKIVASAVGAALGGDIVRVGPGIDGADPLVSAKGITLGAAMNDYMAADDSKVLSEGYHTVDLFGSGSGSANFQADDTRNGAPQDPRVSMIRVDLYA